MHRRKPVVLVADPESSSGFLTQALRDRGLEVIRVEDGEAAMNVLDERSIDGLVTELRLARVPGLSVLRRARARNPDLCAVVISARAGIEAAVEAMREGAYDFQIRPVDRERLLAVLDRGFEHQALKARVVEIEGRLDERMSTSLASANSRAIRRVMDQVRQAAPTHATVLIEGEPGTGKSMVARALHHHSNRRDEAFAWVACGALDPVAIEQEIFGLETGTGPGRRGALEVADGGTLFLDAIGELPFGVQLRLLRLLQDRSFERVGGTETRRTDVRLIASTAVDPAEEVRAGRLRDDLFRRLGAVRIAMPPLRERREDIPVLIESMLAQLNRQHGRRVTGLTPGALERLVRHDWPGNVRQLRNTLEGMVVFAEKRRVLDLSDLPTELRDSKGGGKQIEVAVGMTVEEAERRLILATLEHTGGGKKRAAAILGIGLRTLYRKLERYGIH